MGILIDTSIFIHAEKNKFDCTEYIKNRQPEKCVISVISVSELLHGVYRAKNDIIRSNRKAYIEAIIYSFSVININISIARTHAKLWADLSKNGIMIGLHDSWIAATCLAYDFSLATFNLREFNRIPNLKLEQWK